MNFQHARLRSSERAEGNTPCLYETVLQASCFGLDSLFVRRPGVYAAARHIYNYLSLIYISSVELCILNFGPFLFPACIMCKSKNWYLVSSRPSKREQQVVTHSPPPVSSTPAF